jgi:hypothetical protein
MQRGAHFRTGFIRLHGAVRHPRHMSGDPIDKLIPERTKFLGRHLGAGSARHFLILFSFFVLRFSLLPLSKSDKQIHGHRF